MPNSASRTITWRGFSARLEVPPAVATVLRSLKRLRPAPPVVEAPNRADELRLKPPPAIRVQPREGQRALDFLRDAALAGDGATPNPAAQAYIAETAAKQARATDLQERVDASSWYHTIELPGGIVTPGTHDHRHLVANLQLPSDLTGQRVLDVATFDGFWAFEFERRGAQVVAIDLPDVGGLDFPTGVGDIVAGEALNVPFGDTFALAHQALGSKVRRVARSVYDLDPAELGTFDLVFVGDLLLHLERPLDALRHVRSVTSGRLVLVDRFDPSIGGSGEHLVRYEGGWHGLVWWVPSLPTLAQWLVDAGFDQVEVVGTYQQGTTFGTGAGWHRALVHAHPHAR